MLERSPDDSAGGRSFYSNNRSVDSANIRLICAFPSPTHLMFLEASTALQQAFRFSCHNCSICTPGDAAPLTAFLHKSRLPRYALRHLLWPAATFVRASR